MRAYYNDTDPFVCEWLRNLIAAGHLPPGDVDPRSIEEVSPDDLRKYDQCHFFAGIGGWPLALQSGGWPDSERVWTGSCRVSLFRAPESEKAQPTNATCGPLFGGSSPSASLQRSLESKLREVLDGTGSPLFDLIWSSQGIGLAPPICRLRASAPSTVGSDSSGWPTPNAGPQNDTDSNWQERRARIKAEKKNGNGFGLTLGMAASLAAWPTPLAVEPDKEPLAELERKRTQRSRGIDAGPAIHLGTAVKLTAWPTPNVPSGGRNLDTAERKGGTYYSPSGRKSQLGLEHAAKLAAWGTPRSVESGHSTGNPNRAADRKSRLEDQVMGAWATPTAPRKNDSDESAFRWNPNKKQDDPVMQALGREQPLSDVPTEKRGQLNPAFSRWLMGFPTAWCSYAPSAKRARSLLKPEESLGKSD